MAVTRYLRETALGTFPVACCFSRDAGAPDTNTIVAVRYTADTQKFSPFIPLQTSATQYDTFKTDSGGDVYAWGWDLSSSPRPIALLAGSGADVYLELVHKSFDPSLVSPWVNAELWKSKAGSFNPVRLCGGASPVLPADGELMVHIPYGASDLDIGTDEVLLLILNLAIIRVAPGTADVSMELDLGGTGSISRIIFSGFAVNMSGSVHLGVGSVGQQSFPNVQMRGRARLGFNPTGAVSHSPDMPGRVGLGYNPSGDVFVPPQLVGRAPLGYRGIGGLYHTSEISGRAGLGYLPTGDMTLRPDMRGGARLGYLPTGDMGILKHLFGRVRLGFRALGESVLSGLIKGSARLGFGARGSLEATGAATVWLDDRVPYISEWVGWGE